MLYMFREKFGLTYMFMNHYCTQVENCAHVKSI